MYNLRFGTFTFDDHYIFNDIDLTDLPIRTSSQVITGRDGRIIWKRLYDGRTITIGGVLIGDTASDYQTAWRNLINAFAIGNGTSKVLEITLTNGDVRYIDCKTISLPIVDEEEGKLNEGNFQVVVSAENPYYRGAYTSLTLYAASASGFPVATVIPTPLGGISTNTATINISGDYGSYPSYIINQTVTNPRITNQTTGETFQIEMTVDVSTGPVAISFDERGKHIGTVSNPDMYNQYFNGTYFRLQSGNNNIVFTGADVSGASLELTYANQYISV